MTNKYKNHGHLWKSEKTFPFLSPCLLTMYLIVAIIALLNISVTHYHHVTYHACNCFAEFCKICENVWEQAEELQEQGEGQWWAAQEKEWGSNLKLCPLKMIALEHSCQVSIELRKNKKDDMLSKRRNVGPEEDLALRLPKQFLLSLPLESFSPI